MAFMPQLLAGAMIWTGKLSIPGAQLVRPAEKCVGSSLKVLVVFQKWRSPSVPAPACAWLGPCM